MFTQIVAQVLHVLVAAGMAFQIITLARYLVRGARAGRAARDRYRQVVRIVPTPRKRRFRDYRLALRAARASVAA